MTKDPSILLDLGCGVLGIAAMALAALIGIWTLDSEEELAEKRDHEDDVQMCTREAPHICRVNGPCNGWPKEKYDH